MAVEHLDCTWHRSQKLWRAWVSIHVGTRMCIKWLSLHYSSTSSKFTLVTRADRSTIFRDCDRIEGGRRHLETIGGKTRVGVEMRAKSGRIAFFPSRKMPRFVEMYLHEF